MMILCVVVYCNTKEDTKSRGRAVVTLPVLLFNEYDHYNLSTSASKHPNPHLRNRRRTSKKKQCMALRELRKLADDRDVWAGFTKELCMWGYGEVIIIANID